MFNLKTVKMNVKSHLRESFFRIKPLCDSVMIKPTPEHIAQFMAMVPTVKQESLQELQQYILFPFITHIKSAEIERKYDLLIQIIDAMTLVIQRIKMTIFDVMIKAEIGLLSLVFDRAKLGMVAEVPEELKLSVMKCLTALMLGSTDDIKLQILKTQVPVLAQAVFVSVHIAKLERLRALRLASIECLSAHTMSHRTYADSRMYLKNAVLDEPTADYLSNILPGVLAALQDVAMCKDNPGHAIIVAALDTTHRVLCITMNNKRLKKKAHVNVEDFTAMIARSIGPKQEKDAKESASTTSSTDATNATNASKTTNASNTQNASKTTNASNTPNASKTTNASNTPNASKTTNASNTPNASNTTNASKTTNASNTPNASKITNASNTPNASKTTNASGAPNASSTPNASSASNASNSPNASSAAGKQEEESTLPVRNVAWYLAAGEKLLLVTRSLAPLVTHEHFRVRRELAVLSARIVRECCITMPSSVPLALDILLTLSNDEYTEVSTYCNKAIKNFFNKSTHERRAIIMDGVCENFFIALTNLPRVLNNIDSSHKLSSLNLVRGSIEVLCDQARPQRLTVAVSAADRCDTLCDALVAAAALRHDLTLLTKHNGGDIACAPVSNCPWLSLRHLDSVECQQALQSIIQQLAGAECCELLLDRLLELFHQRRDCELVYIMNWMGSAPEAPTSLAKRIISTYIEEDIWYLPLDIGTNEQPLTKAETLDPSVYNPRAWVKDSVPGLYEGATEVRYTDISYQNARVRTQPAADTCRTVAQSQRHLAMSCLLTEGLGQLARRLGRDYQPYLLKTLCLVLERVGSKYEVLHKAGSKALQELAAACDLPDAAALIAHNADYFTNQISRRLKKAWDVQSALQILTVVMTYSDTSILEYLYAIVEDVLVQSCDKYHRKNLFAYLQVFECFVYCIHKWFPLTKSDGEKKTSAKAKDYLKDFNEHVENTEKVEKLLSNEEFERETGKSAEEMYREDLKKREDDVLDYDDTVTQENPPLPKHVAVTITILKRTINFIGTKERDESILAMHILLLGFPILSNYEDELLPLIHQCWAPFVSKLRPQEPLVMRKAFELLLAMADVSKDFIRHRAVKDVIPHVVKFLTLSATESYLKDAGAAYRLSPAYSLQTTMLTQLPFLVQDLALTGRQLEPALASVAPYLHAKQPRQLQFLAVQFYKLTLKYDYCATWCYLRRLCANDDVLQPPAAKYVQLQPLVGTPYRAVDKEIDANIKDIFEMLTTKRRYN